MSSENKRKQIQQIQNLPTNQALIQHCGQERRHLFRVGDSSKHIQVRVVDLEFMRGSGKMSCVIIENLSCHFATKETIL